MTAIINDMLFSYVNKSGKTVKGMRFSSGPQDRYAFEVFSQAAIRLGAFLGRHGRAAILVLDGFAAGKPMQATRTFSYDEYNGHKLIVLPFAEGDKSPLKMGLAKAGKVSAAIKAHGIEAVVATLQDVIGDAKPTDGVPRKGKAKSKGTGQGGQKSRKSAGKSKGMPADLDMDMDEVEEMVAAMSPAAPSDDLAGKIARNEAMIAAMFEEITRLQAETRTLKAMREAVAV